jgi:rhodanese-related sulfurtransferase
MSELIEFVMRHPLLVGGSLMALITTVGYEVRLRMQAAFAIPAPQAVRLINQGATVVDLRDAARFSAGHIADAINLTADALKSDPESRLKKKRPVVLVCDNGSNSAKLAGVLRQAGFESAWSLEGGQAGWERDNLPVVAVRAKT